jgi:hypothetical protein
MPIDTGDLRGRKLQPTLRRLQAMGAVAVAMALARSIPAPVVAAIERVPRPRPLRGPLLRPRRGREPVSRVVNSTSSERPAGDASRPPAAKAATAFRHEPHLGADLQELAPRAGCGGDRSGAYPYQAEYHMAYLYLRRAAAF